MRKNRLEKIVEIITEHDVETQDELLEYLRAEGFDVTQATVSRDIRELKLIKGNSEYGKYCYMLPKVTRDERLHFNSALAEAITKVDYAQNIVVLHTYAGMAQAVAIEIDKLGLAQVLGCVAGDDTIIVITRDNDSSATISNQLKELIRVRGKNGDGV